LSTCASGTIFLSNSVELRTGRNVKKLKKKLQKVFKKGEKRGKVRKIEKKDAKRCTNYDVFSKSG
jgi:hypothetical protein